jgi:Holliday junction resolvasome RuvABC endonuclease subunit
MRVAGIDLGSRISAIVLLHTFPRKKWKHINELRIIFEGVHSIQRVQSFKEQFYAYMVTQAPQIAIVEDLAYGSRHKSLIQLTEIRYVTQEVLLQLHIPYIFISPKSLKLFVTGSGKSDKKIMRECCVKRWKYEGKDNNLVDAFCLAMSGVTVIQNPTAKIAGLDTIYKIFSLI